MVITAKYEDIEPIANELRKEDTDEVIAIGLTGKEALEQSFQASFLCYTVFNKDKPAGMFGIVPETLLGERAVVWFLGSNEMKHIKLTFMKQSKTYIDLFLGYYPLLFNLVDSRYTDSIKWLKWCGAKFEEPVKIGLGGVDFIPFSFRRC